MENELRGHQHITPILTLLHGNRAPRCTLDSSTARIIVAHALRLARTFAIDVTEGAQLTLKEAQQFSVELSYRLQVTWAAWILWAMWSYHAVEWGYTAMRLWWSDFRAAVCSMFDSTTHRFNQHKHTSSHVLVLTTYTKRVLPQCVNAHPLVMAGHGLLRISLHNRKRWSSIRWSARR